MRLLLGVVLDVNLFVGDCVRIVLVVVDWRVLLSVDKQVAVLSVLTNDVGEVIVQLVGMDGVAFDESIFLIMFLIFLDKFPFENPTWQHWWFSIFIFCQRVLLSGNFL